ncbi:MAG: hypothetical protein H6606_10255 [Flavobacteriales bacterium]|nr:hypothetical protein [Flavobacteriales bacterium]
MKQINWIRVLGILAGMLIGGVVVGFVEGIGHEMFPLPEGFDSNNKDNIRAYLDTAPTLAILMVPIAWIVGAFCASFIATLIAPKYWRSNRFIISAIFLILSIAMLTMLPSTWYMWAIALLLLFPFGFMGSGLAGMIRKERMSSE